MDLTEIGVQNSMVWLKRDQKLIEIRTTHIHPRRKLKQKMKMNVYFYKSSRIEGHAIWHWMKGFSSCLRNITDMTSVSRLLYVMI